MALELVTFKKQIQGLISWVIPLSILELTNIYIFFFMTAGGFVFFKILDFF
jgi:hypothetical protein